MQLCRRKIKYLFFFMQYNERGNKEFLIKEWTKNDCVYKIYLYLIKCNQLNMISESKIYCE